MGNTSTASVSRTGTSICYSSLGIGTPFENFTGSGFTHGSDPTFDDILMNKPAGTRIDEITFSGANFNTTTVTGTAIVALFNATPDPLNPGLTIPDFNSPKAQITVTGLEQDTFTANLFTIDVKDQNIIKKDETIWAGLVWVAATDAEGTDQATLLSNLGQATFGPSTKGFSDNFFYTGGGLAAFSTLYSNFGWEFRSVPTPGAMAIFGLAGVAATRRRR